MVESISIHALREEGDRIGQKVISMVESISIHALREEGDVIWHTETDSSIISIHALREEGDHDAGR